MNICTRRFLPFLLATLAIAGEWSLSRSVIAADDSDPPQPLTPEIAAASNEANEAIAGFQLSDGWEMSLYAAEPDVANIVAFDVDNVGRVFVCESFRQNRGVTDNREHDETWLRADLAAQTVEDRIAYHRRLLGDAASTYTEQDDQIRLLRDTDGDGRADRSQIYASGFNRLEEGTGAGVLARGPHVYYTNIPRLYDLIDSDSDGRADERVVMSNGYGVRVAFRGHDMHGLIIGPDGRLYFSIGDRGYHVTTPAGELLHNPAVGAVFRCELDGSHLEVFANGLRNPQELAFNDYGDLFTGDNNSDSGDRARLVHVLQDGDSGWRMFYQYLPDRGPFNREKIWEPFHDEQPAYIVPPIANFADGPSGFAYYPGTGFGDALKDTFLLADFRGSPSNSGIRTVRLEPEGAFYKIAEDGQAVWRILATDITFGPDGAMFVSDWVNGWNGEGKGRLYRVTDPQHVDSELVKEVQRRLASDWTSIDVPTLAELLGHVDRRLRLEAQWELAARGETGVLSQVAGDAHRDLFSRLHAVWGLEQIVRRDAAAGATAVPVIRELLTDSNPYLRAAAVQFAGQHAEIGAADQIVNLLGDDSPRVRYFAARAAGWRGMSDAFDAVVLMLAENDNRDPVLRHGGVMGLSQLADDATLATLASHASANVRRAAVVALRRRHSQAVAEFLSDGDGRVVAEAARAIHDLPIEESLPALAAMIDRPLQDDAVIRRVLNANFRLGGAEHAAALADYAGNQAAPEAMRLEALAMLGDWQAPDERDRVLNQWRPLEDRPSAQAAAALQESLAPILSGPESVRSAAVSLAADLGLSEITPLLSERLENAELPAGARAAALRAMLKLAPQLALQRAQTVLANADSAPELRVAAIETLVRLQPAESTEQVVASARDGESLQERQAAWDALAEIDTDAAREQIARGAAELIQGPLTTATALNVFEAVQANGGEAIAERLQSHIDQVATTDPLAPWLLTLSGGDPTAGKTLFFTKTELSCVRCHKVGQQGGDVGPNLAGIGKEKDPHYLLEAIVAPDAQIAKGFETTMLAHDLGTTHIGIIRAETDETIDLVKADGSQVRLRTDEIVARRRGQSAMPADLTKFMSRRELRDLVAYLTTLKEPPAEATEGAHGAE